MTSIPYPLPLLPTHLESTVKLITIWMREAKGVLQLQVDQVVTFLNENYLRSTPLPKDAFFAQGSIGCRHWFRVFSAWVMGWKCRKDEKHPGGFLAELNYHLRNYAWPEEKMMRRWWRNYVSIASNENCDAEDTKQKAVADSPHHS